MINDKELLEKAERNEGLTVEEVKRYQELVPPKKQTYGKYGTLALRYLEESNPAKMWGIEDLPAYLHKIDEQADELYDRLWEKLSGSEQYKRTGDYMTDVRRINAMKQVIEEEILNELVYVG